MDARAEALLYAADRAHHIATVVRPALERGEIVVQDRYLDSSIAYQGTGRELGADEVRDLSLWAARGLLPDLTVLFDLDPEEGADASAPPVAPTTGSKPNRKPSTTPCARPSSASHPQTPTGSS